MKKETVSTAAVLEELFQEYGPELILRACRDLALENHPDKAVEIESTYERLELEILGYTL